MESPPCVVKQTNDRKIAHPLKAWEKYEEVGGFLSAMCEQHGCRVHLLDAF